VGKEVRGRSEPAREEEEGGEEERRGKLGLEWEEEVAKEERR